jgi:hypothetical protein
MTSFRTFKDLITKHEYRRKITDINLISASIWQIQSIFKPKKMKPASISTFIHFLSKIRELLSAAYPVRVVAMYWHSTVGVDVDISSR